MLPVNRSTILAWLVSMSESVWMYWEQRWRGAASARAFWSAAVCRCARVKSTSSAKATEAASTSARGTATPRAEGHRPGGRPSRLLGVRAAGHARVYKTLTGTLGINDARRSADRFIWQATRPQRRATPNAESWTAYSLSAPGEVHAQGRGESRSKK